MKSKPSISSSGETLSPEQAADGALIIDLALTEFAAPGLVTLEHAAIDHEAAAGRLEDVLGAGDGADPGHEAQEGGLAGARGAHHVEYEHPVIGKMRPQPVGHLLVGIQHISDHFDFPCAAFFGCNSAAAVFRMRVWMGVTRIVVMVVSLGLKKLFRY